MSLRKITTAALAGTLLLLLAACNFNNVSEDPYPGKTWLNSIKLTYQQQYCSNLFEKRAVEVMRGLGREKFYIADVQRTENYDYAYSLRDTQYDPNLQIIEVEHSTEPIVQSIAVEKHTTRDVSIADIYLLSSVVDVYAIYGDPHQCVLDNGFLVHTWYMGAYDADTHAVLTVYAKDSTVQSICVQRLPKE